MIHSTISYFMHHHSGCRVCFFNCFLKTKFTHTHEYMSWTCNELIFLCIFFRQHLWDQISWVNEHKKNWNTVKYAFHILCLPFLKKKSENVWKNFYEVECHACVLLSATTQYGVNVYMVFVFVYMHNSVLN